MKKQLIVACGLAVLATPAFATKARLEALGEDNYGSYYINDNRNIFLNPARINDNKDLVTYEFGASGNGASGVDSAATPKAEGGFTKAHGNMVYGLHFGNTTPQVGLVRSLAADVDPATGDVTEAVAEQQPFDFFIGGDAGVKWGANVTYEDYNGGRTGGTGSRLSSHSLRTRLGVIMGDIDVFAHISLNNDAKNYNGASVEGDLGYLLGGSYMFNNYRLIAEFRQIDAEYSGAATAGQDEDFEYNQFRIGAARQERLNDKATLFAKAWIVRQSAEDDGGALGANTQALGQNTFRGAGEATVYTLPLTVGTEYNATSWLDLRASVSHNVWSRAVTDPKNGKENNGHVANTAVRAGASLKFGEFAVDGLVSTDTEGNGTGMAADGSTDAGNGTLRTDNLMTRVSMIYRF